MSRRLVQDVMTRDVVTVHVGTGFRGVVRIVLDQGVGALPVVDEAGRVVGVVSETDLIAKQIKGADVEPRAWSTFTRAGRRARSKRPALVAARLMTEPAVTVGPEASLGRAAYLMSRHDVRHLPVVDADRRPLGLVSRGDLLREFLRDDDEIREDIVRDYVVGEFGLDPEHLHVEVEQGVVTLSGGVRLRSTASALAWYAAGVPGVVQLHDRLTWQADESAATRRPRRGSRAARGEVHPRTH